MYITKDRKYLLKTINDAELQFLKESVLLQYMKRISENENSILVHITGAYTVGNLQIIVMKNIFPHNDDNPFEPRVVRRYDLKGSTVRRDVCISTTLKTSHLFLRLETILQKNSNTIHTKWVPCGHFNFSEYAQDFNVIKSAVKDYFC